VRARSTENSWSALGARQKTGCPVFERRVTISPALWNERSNRSASLGPNPVNIIRPIAERMCTGDVGENGFAPARHGRQATHLSES
jgi:hypothetical protein